MATPTPSPATDDDYSDLGAVPSTGQTQGDNFNDLGAVPADHTLAEKTLGILRDPFSTVLGKGTGKSIEDNIVNLIGMVGQKLDPYTLAPARKAISTAQNANLSGQNPDEPVTGLIGKPLEAAFNQFGEPGAPTSKDIAAKAGASTKDEYLSDILERRFASEHPGDTSDPHNIPLTTRSPLANIYSKDPNSFQLRKYGDFDPKVSEAGLAGGIVEANAPGVLNSMGLIGKSVSNAAELGQGLNQGLLKDISTGIKGAQNFPNNVGEFLSHVPGEDIDTLRNKYQPVQDLVNQWGENVPAAVEDFRKRAIEDTAVEKAHWNSDIGNFVDNVNKENPQSFETQPFIDDIDNIKKDVSKSADKNLGLGIRDRLNSIKQMIIDMDKDGDGRISSKNVWQIYDQTKDMMGSHAGANGEMYTPSGPEKRAIEVINRRARGYLDTIDDSNKTLGKALQAHSDLHDIDDALKTTVLKPGAATSAVTGNVDPANASRLQMQKLSDITGKNYLEQMDNLSAYRSIYNPSPSGNALQKTIGIPIVRGLVGATQPGYLGGKFSGPGYWNSIRAGLRGTRINEQNKPQVQP